METKTLNLKLTYEDFLQIMLFSQDHADEEPVCRRLFEICQEKLDRLIQHDLYSRSKTAPTAEQKEKARQEYLDKKGIPESFRW